MMKQFLISLLALSAFLMFIQDGWGQTHGDHDHDEGQHEHDSHAEEHEHDHTNEISLAVGVVPIPKEDVIGASLHLHYVRGLGEKKIIGIGGGIEAILETHKHITFSTVFHVRIYKGLIAGYSPGILLLVEEDGTDVQFAQHFELAYEFELGRFHLGPVFEVGIEKEGVHYMGGVHFGLDF